MPLRFQTLLIGLITIAPIITWAAHRLAPESAPVARGAHYAQTKGCIECHGKPELAVAEESSGGCANTNTMAQHPEYSVKCTDVLAYFEAIRLYRTLEDRAKSNRENKLVAGEQLARKYYCFQCHGHLGQGGFKNEGSLKGYVPGYFGNDFRTLTNNADPDSIRLWIMNGMDPAILGNPLTAPIANMFLENQAIRMPRYKSLPPAEIEMLVNYVIALNKFGPMSASQIRKYGGESGLNQNPRESGSAP